MIHKIICPHTHLAIPLTARWEKRIVGAQTTIPAYIDGYRALRDGRELAIFDVDGTAYRGVIGKDFSDFFIGVNKFKLRSLPSHLINWPRYRFAKNVSHNFVAYNELGVQQMWGTPETEIRTLAEAFWGMVPTNERIRAIEGPLVYPEWITALQRERADSRRIAFVTGSVIYPVFPFAAEHGIEIVVGNRPKITAEGRCSLRIDRPLVIHSGKTAIVSALLRALNVAAGKVNNYTDDPILDRHTIDFLATPPRTIVVDNFGRHAALAAQNKWSVIRFEDQTGMTPETTEKNKRARKRLITEIADNYRRSLGKTVVKL